MKKFIASAFIILVFPLIIPFVCKANYEAPNGTTYKYKYKLHNNNTYTEYYTNSKCVAEGWVGQGSAGYRVCTLNELTDNIGDVLYNANSNNVIVTNIYPSYNGNSSSQGYVFPSINRTGNLFTSTVGQIEGYSDIPLYNSQEDAYAYITTPDVDFDNIYYSAQIPIPSIDVYMGSDVVNPSSGQAVWNASMEFGDNPQYYIQYGYKASFPSYIDVGLASLRGDFSYNYYNYTSTNYIDIVSLESLTNAVNQSKPASYFQTAWQSFYNDYLTESLVPEFGSQVNAMSSAMLDDAKDYYVDYMLGQIPMYGNRLEIFARYFTIDEENDNRVIVGAWNHWNSKDGSRTKERPSNYIDNVALPGNIISNTDPDFQTNDDTYSSNGETTGTPATIINNNYAPNYPDYPTVVTYNHDNILLNFMDTARQLPSFFGEFTGFLTVAFGFIPSWIWAIVGAGFTFSIVIMIIKVL